MAWNLRKLRATVENSAVGADFMRLLVRAVGVEPTRAYAPQILSLVCLPFHHARFRLSY